jgi:importin-5
LLRKCVVKGEESLYPHLSEKVQEYLKVELLKALQNEEDASIRKKLVYALSGLSSGLLEEGEFKELIPTMFNWTKPDSPLYLRESALNVFSQLATFILEKGLSPYLDVLKNVLGACLKDDSPKIKLAAHGATTAILLVLSKKSVMGFVELLPLMLSAFGDSLSLEDGVPSSTTYLETFIEIASEHPLFFKKYLDKMITAMFKVANSENLEQGLRHLAMEFMVTFCEISPNLMKGINGFVKNLFPLCLKFMLDLEYDEEEWMKQVIFIFNF